MRENAYSRKERREGGKNEREGEGERKRKKEGGKNREGEGDRGIRSGMESKIERECP